MPLRRRLLLATLLALAATVLLVPSAGAGNFDEQRMGCTGEDPATCATGEVGKPYSLIVRLIGDEDTGCAVVSVSSGSLPPGLSITQQFNETKTAVISGTPTEAGNFSFYLNVNYYSKGCPKPDSQDRFIIPIKPGLPKLTIGPESAPSGTVGAPYSLPMTATVPEAKTWSIASGTLPPGLTIDANTGVISGTPTTAGAYTFTVLAKMNSDDRSDTKTLGIEIREPVAVTSEAFETARREPAEVSVSFEVKFTATGGTGQYTWALASGALPAGLAFADGTISGVPRTAGAFPFAITATDTEGRVATFAARILVAPKLTLTTRFMPAARVGRAYRLQLRTTGGIRPVIWRKMGPLPRGLTFNRTTGTITGNPRRAGRFRVAFVATDSFKVQVQRTFLLRVRPAPQAR